MKEVSILDRIAYFVIGLLSNIVLPFAYIWTIENPTTLHYGFALVLLATAAFLDAKIEDGNNNTKTVNVIADTFSEVTDRLRKLYNNYESGWTYDDIISVVKIDLEGEIV